MLLSTHLKAGSKASSAALRRLHLNLIADMLRDRGPVLVMGDFNASESEDYVKSFIDFLKLKSLEKGLPTAYKWKRQKAATGPRAQEGNLAAVETVYAVTESKIDYMLYPAEWKLQQRENAYRPALSTDAPSYHVLPNEICPSDHIPLIAIFAFRA